MSKLRGHIDEAVRSSVEETLNTLLDAEAESQWGAKRYERSAERVDTLAGYYERTLETKAGEVKLKVPKLRKLPFGTRSSSGILEERLQLKRRLWRCTWPA